jgi:hypothetical protein
MMDRTYRQKIIDEYMNAMGANHFLPADFLNWLRPQTTHRAWMLFFGQDDEQAAANHRLNLVRQFISGLRIRVMVSDISDSPKKMRFSVELPAYISPVSGRAAGGGYFATDPDDPETRRELARQAAADLKRVFERHKGVAALFSMDLSEIENLAKQFDALGIEVKLEMA